MELKIQNIQGNLIKMDYQQIQKFLEQACQENHQPHSIAAEILNKLSKYLEIFLLNPNNILSLKQLTDLVENIAQESHQTAIGQSFSRLLNKTDLSEIKEDSIFPKYIQEKFKKLFLPPAESNLSFDELATKITSINSSPEISEKIKVLFLAKIFFPHQNILKGKNHFDQTRLVLRDDLDAIFEGLKITARNFQNLINTCVDFSKLRPKLALIKSIKSFSSGPISFIKIYAATIETLRQSISSEFIPHHTFILNIHHPDILELLIFIKNFQKNSLNRHCHFQIEISPNFLEALSKEENFELINPENGQTVNLLSAKHTFDLIISTIQENPQLEIFSTDNKNQDTHAQQSISGIFNLGPYGKVSNPTEKISTDLKTIESFLQQQLQESQKNNSHNSHIQINFTGWHDFLINQKIPYASIQALEKAQEICTTINNALQPETFKSIALSSPLLTLLESSQGLENHDSLISSRTNIEGEEKLQPIAPLATALQSENLYLPEIIKIIGEQNSLHNLYQFSTANRNLFQLGHEIPADFHLSLQKIFEKAFGEKIEKKIFLEKNLDLEETKKMAQNQLLEGLHKLGHLQFEPILDENYSDSTINDKNYLHNLSRHKRRHREIQPPLFQLKKTEEIKIPPINSTQK